MVGSIRGLAGSYAVMAGLLSPCWRRWRLFWLTYLFVELGSYWAWALTVLDKLLFCVLNLVYFCVCGFTRLLYALQIDYLLMGHNGLYVWWCTGCARFTQSVEGNFSCVVSLATVLPFCRKTCFFLHHPKTKFGSLEVFVPKFWVLRLFSQSRLLRQSHSASLHGVLLGVLGTSCVLPSVDITQGITCLVTSGTPLNEIVQSQKCKKHWYCASP